MPRLTDGEYPGLMEGVDAAMGFFGSKDKSSGAAGTERISRHSSGWGEILKRMQAEPSLRVLDIGPTSSGNINFITSLGHSIYLANLVEDAAKREWMLPAEGDQPARFDVEKFLTAHLDFSGRGFDVVLLWDIADYLPEQLLAPVLDRIHRVMAPGGQLLAFFHAGSGSAAAAAAGGEYSRYHLTAQPTVEMQRAGSHPVLQTYNSREIEKLFAKFQSFRFFLAKDNLREVVVTR